MLIRNDKPKCPGPGLIASKLWCCYQVMSRVSEHGVKKVHMDSCSGLIDFDYSLGSLEMFYMRVPLIISVRLNTVFPHPISFRSQKCLTILLVGFSGFHTIHGCYKERL